MGGTGWSAGACFVDYDRDGRLDLIVTRYLDWDFSRNIYCGEQKPGYRALLPSGRVQADNRISSSITTETALSLTFRRNAASARFPARAWASPSTTSIATVGRTSCGQ